MLNTFLTKPASLAVICSLVSFGCGESASDLDQAPTEPEPLAILGVSSQLDDGPIVPVDTTGLDEPVLDAGLITESSIEVQVELQPANTDRACWLGALSMEETRPEIFSLNLQPAYFEESVELKCSDGNSTVSQFIVFKARDPELENYIGRFVHERIPKANDRRPADPYSGFRQDSYYAAIYTFLAAAELYLQPERYGIDPNGEEYKQLEQFLINGSEAYFEPCTDYDVFTSFPSRQCRSSERVGEFYVWRSAETKDTVRTDHAKTEWRGAGGIAQAIKAILLRNPGPAEPVCPTSNEPSSIRDASLFCRAINVRRLLFEEVWRKWDSAIQRTEVPHYIAWTELTVDLFNSTEGIAPNYGCLSCSPDQGPQHVAPQTADLLSFFSYDADGLLNMKCRSPGSTRPCVWTTYDFSVAGSVEIGHQDVLIHLMTRDDQQRVCAENGGGNCLELHDLAASFGSRTWAASEDGPDANGFPKFDMFFNGYCSKNFAESASSLQDFCWKFWYSETSNWPAHRKLMGWVNLGRYDRSLMIKLRQAADENHDGLLNTGDPYLRTFAVFLYRAQKANGEISLAEE